MDRVEQIEKVIDSLLPEDYNRFARWFRERDQSAWDRQMDDDASTGKLDFLFDEADEESRSELLKEWPPAE